MEGGREGGMSGWGVECGGRYGGMSNHHRLYCRTIDPQSCTWHAPEQGHGPEGGKGEEHDDALLDDVVVRVGHLQAELLHHHHVDEELVVLGHLPHHVLGKGGGGHTCIGWVVGGGEGGREGERTRSLAGWLVGWLVGTGRAGCLCLCLCLYGIDLSTYYTGKHPPIHPIPPSIHSSCVSPPLKTTGVPPPLLPPHLGIVRVHAALYVDVDHLSYLPLPEVLQLPFRGEGFFFFFVCVCVCVCVCVQVNNQCEHLT